MSRIDSLMDLIGLGIKKTQPDPTTGTVSKLDEAILNMRQNKMQANQIENALMGMNAGVKRAEIQDTGLDRWLAQQQGSVTQEDIARYLDQQREPIGLQRYETAQYKPLESLPPLQPVPSDAFGMTDELRSLENPLMQLDFTEPVSGRRYQVEPTADRSLYRTYEHMGNERQALRIPVETDVAGGGVHRSFSPPTNMDEALQAINRRRIEGTDTTRHSGITDPGLDRTSYKEDVFTLPARGSDINLNAYSHENHWPGVENPLVHLRSSHRELDDGGFAVHIEELQSDWHQQARQKGAYWSPENANAAIDASEQANRKLTDLVKKGNFETDDIDMVSGYDSRVNYINDFGDEYRLAEIQIAEDGTKTFKVFNDNVKKAFPDGAPDNIEELLEDAANKQISVRSHREAPPDAPLKGDEWAFFGVKQAIKRAIDEGASGVTLPSGEDMILKEGVMGDAKLENTMRKMYDEKLPSILKKIGKQYGVKPETRKVFYGEDDVERTFLPLTDEMIEKIMNEGMKKYGKQDAPKGILDSLGDMYV